MTKLPNNPLVFEIFKAAHGAKTVERKLEILTEYKGDHIKALFIWNFDKGIESALPKGEVPYRKNQAPANTPSHTRLEHEWHILYNFIRGGNDSLSQMKKEQMFIQLLEGLHAEDAEILLLVKDKELQSKYRITRNVVEQAYPEIVWRDR
jgi:hypothetical protein